MAACSTTRRNSRERSESFNERLLLAVRFGVAGSGVRRQLAPRRPIDAVAEQVVGLHQLVDFARALIDDRALAIAIEASDRILVRVAVRPVDLHGVAGGALRGDGGEPFRQTGLAR